MRNHTNCTVYQYYYGTEAKQATIKDMGAKMG
jgi:hypothetical protein